MVRMKILMALAAIIFLAGNPAYARTSDRSEVVVIGSGATKEEALQQALQKAVSQAYGVFNYSSTQIENDDLVKSRDLSVSAGTISSYKELGSIQRTDGGWELTVSVVLGLSKFIPSAKVSEGSSQSVKITVSPMRESFIANEKLEELRLVNESAVLSDMLEVVSELLDVSLFQTSIESTKPIVNNDGDRIRYELKGTVTYSPQFVALDRFVYTTLCSLSDINGRTLKDKDKGEYNEVRMSAPTYRSLSGKNKILIDDDVFTSIVTAMNNALNSILSSYTFFRNGRPVDREKVVAYQPLPLFKSYTLSNKATYKLTVTEDIRHAEDVEYTLKSLLK